MNPNLQQYMNEKNITPSTLAIINVLIELGGPVPLHYLEHEYHKELKTADSEGYVSILDDKIQLTMKSHKFIETLLLLAKEEGEI